MFVTLKAGTNTIAGDKPEKTAQTCKGHLPSARDDPGEVTAIKQPKDAFSRNRCDYPKADAPLSCPARHAGQSRAASPHPTNPDLPSCANGILAWLSVQGGPKNTTHRMSKAVVCLAVASVAGLGQTTQGLISGRVLDARSARPVPGAAIRCDSPLGGPRSLSHSGANGYFVLPLLSPGLYRLRIEAAGYQAQELYRVDLPVAGRLDYQFRLRLLDDVWEAGEYRSVFIPNSRAVLTFFGPDVDTSHSVILDNPRTGQGALESSISQVVDPVEVEDLPLAGRDIYTTLILQPGVAAGTADARGLGLAVSGQRPTSSNFLLDGVENNNYLVSGPLSMVAPEAVGEYRISTNNFSAEYGGTAGVLANAVTRAGGGQWHGIAYFYWQNGTLDGNDFQRNLTGLPGAPLHQAQPGFQGGGPILKNRLFSSTSFEYLRSRSDSDPVTVSLPTTGFLSYLANIAPRLPSASYATQLLQQHPFPAPQSALLGPAPVSVSIPDFADQWLALERLDYALPGGKHRLTARLSDNHLDRPDFLWSPYRGFDAPLTQNTVAVMAALTSTFSPNITHEARLSWSSDSIGWNRPYPNIPTLVSADGATLPGSSALYSYRNRNRTFELSDELVWLHGAHLLQFGGGFLLRGISGFLTAGRDGRYFFNTILDFASGGPYQFQTIVDRVALPDYQLPDYNRTYSYNQFNLFAQDTFRVTPRLSVNYGVRYENFGAPRNTGTARDQLFEPGPGLGLPQMVAGGTLTAPEDESVYGSDNRGWAGRLGSSYDLAGKGRTLLRGAYGIFYDRPFDNLWQNVRLNSSALQTFDIAANYTNFLSPYLPQLPGFIPELVPSTFPSVTWIDPRLRNAYVQSFFLGVQQRVTERFTLEVNGAGELGRKLIATDILNRGSADNSQLPEILYRANQGSSDYNALTVLARYRSSRAQFQAAYTWSHSIDNQSSPLAGDFFDVAFVRLTSGAGYEVPAAFTEEGNSRADRGNSDFDQRHNLVISAIVNLPQPRAAAPFAWLLRDWRLATLESFRSGFPFTVYAAGCPSQIVNCRADLVNPAAVHERTPVPGGEQLLNPAAFADPISGTGNLGRNSIAGPGLLNIDVSLNRSIPLKWLGEAGRLNLRADAFNFLNHANLGNPDPFLGDATFGQATYGRKAQPTGFPGLLPLNETARRIQLMLRVEW